MIIPLSPSIDPTSIHASVCIVGAGAAGITLACELDGCGFGVLLLDAGGLKADLAHSRLLYAGTAGAPHPDPTEFRRTGFGGTTRIWGGRCVPFDPIDFERRDYVPNSGWPIAYDDIARHYERALQYCHAGSFDFSVGGSISGALPTLPGVEGNGDILPDRIERYSLPTDFGREHRKKLAASRNVTVLLDARCLRLIKADGEDRIEAAEVIDRRMTRHAIRARRFVVATGGIEATRLLFVSDRDGPGLGNRGDRLGRYYACHIENVCARLTTEPGRKVAFAFEKTDDGVYARRKLQFSADAQRRHRLLNSAFRLHFPDYSDASHGSAVMSAIFLGKSALISEYRAILQHGSEAQGESTKAAHLRNVLLGAPQLARFGADLLMKRVLARRKLPYTLVANADGSYPLEFNAEQIPLEDSRITLSNERDAVGVPLVRLDWRVSDEDFEAAERAFHVLRAAVARTPHVRVHFDDADLRRRVRASVPVGGHHIGSARMATSERSGVVDCNCAVFGLSNLFVASAATFPTSSHANPTLTIVAHAIRLAALLRAAG